MSPVPSPAEPKPRRLLDQVRDKLRTLHYSPRTEDAYLQLRIQDLTLGYRQFTVHNGKGAKDRFVPLPEALIPSRKERIQGSERLLESDLTVGFGEVSMPELEAGCDIRPVQEPMGHKDVTTTPDLYPCATARRIGRAEPRGCLAGGTRTDSGCGLRDTGFAQPGHQGCRTEARTGWNQLRVRSSDPLNPLRVAASAAA
jgi:hypothetical protein